MQGERTKFTVEITIGGNLRERLEWVQKWFDFFHPRLGAKVTHAEVVLPPVPPQPSALSLLD